MKTVTVRIEDQLKAQAEEILAEHGVSPTEAVNHLYLYVAQHGRLPFRVRPVSESPEDVYRAMLHRVRSVTGLLAAVAGLPAESAERAGMADLCVRRCRQLRQDIAGNTAFMAAVSYCDRLPRTDDENTGLYWRWIQDHLAQAEAAIDTDVPDPSGTLPAVVSALTPCYWQLATYIDHYQMNDAAAPFEYDRDAAHAGHTFYYGKKER